MILFSTAPFLIATLTEDSHWNMYSSKMRYFSTRYASRHEITVTKVVGARVLKILNHILGNTWGLLKQLFQPHFRTDSASKTENACCRCLEKLNARFCCLSIFPTDNLALTSLFWNWHKVCGQSWTILVLYLLYSLSLATDTRKCVAAQATEACPFLEEMWA